MCLYSCIFQKKKNYFRVEFCGRSLVDVVMLIVKCCVLFALQDPDFDFGERQRVCTSFLFIFCYFCQFCRFSLVIYIFTPISAYGWFELVFLHFKCMKNSNPSAIFFFCVTYFCSPFLFDYPKKRIVVSVEFQGQLGNPTSLVAVVGLSCTVNSGYSEQRLL